MGQYVKGVTELAPHLAVMTVKIIAMATRASERFLFKRAAASLAFAVGALALAPAPARADEGLFKSLFEAAGFATPEPKPLDFVVKARDGKPDDYIPIYQPPGEPPSVVDKPAMVEATRAALESGVKAHDALRAAFPPAAKAVADAKAAAAAKGKKKKIPDDPAAQ